MSYSNVMEDENIVITGMSGKFAASDTVYHYRDNLFNKIDIVSGDFGKYQRHPELPKKIGKINDLDKFDMGFFGVTSLQSDNMDPMIRIALEKAYEAIVDAGYHPSDLVNSFTGVFFASSAAETEVVFYEVLKPSCHSITGIHRSLAAKRISYHFKLKGPSYQLDSACSSSLNALEQAYMAIKEGRCSKAIVCSGNICLRTATSIDLSRLGVLSHDGKSKSFNNDVDGYARSEAVVVLLLEKSSEAKRIYAEITHAKANCDGYKAQGISFPSMELQKTLMKELHSECKVAPTDLTFMEAHCTGTYVGDIEELNALDDIFCRGTDRPLYIGSVKSNLGHTEASAGLCSVVKILLAMETGFIPPNINYYIPRKGIEGLEKGRMKVVTEKLSIPDKGEFFGINSFGFGGANGYVLLRRNCKAKVDRGNSNNGLPILICVSARVEQGIHVILDDFLRQIGDAEYAYLIHQVFKKSHENHIYRGYGIYDKQRETIRSLVKSKDGNLALCFVFTDYHKDWLHIGRQLIILPVFLRIMKCIQFTSLQTKGVDILKILTGSEEGDLNEQILTAIAVQIGFGEVLKEIKLIPDQIIGIGTGELVASYMKNCRSLEETIFEMHRVVYDLDKNGYENSKVFEEITSARHHTSKSKHNRSHLVQFDKQVQLTNTLFLVIGSNAGDSSNILLLVDVNSNNYIQDFLSNLGILYQRGYHMNLDSLYPAVNLPVSRGTPMLSPLIKWNHDRNSTVYTSNNDMGTKSDYVIAIDLKTKKWDFILGHVIQGEIVFPISGCLILTWETLAMMLGKYIEDTKVVFENVSIVKIPTIPKNRCLVLTVVIHIATQTFEIVEDGVIFIKGNIYEQTEDHRHIDSASILVDQADLVMNEKDIYNVLRLRGYQYSGKFKCLKKCNTRISQAVVEWNGDWISYMECILQLALLFSDTRKSHCPKSIQRLMFDPSEHLNTINNMTPINLYREIGVISYYENISLTISLGCAITRLDLESFRAAGLEITGYEIMNVEQNEPDYSVLEVAKFVSNQHQLDSQNSIKSFVQLIMENVDAAIINIVEICLVGQAKNQLLHPIVEKAIDELPLYKCTATVVTNKQLDLLKFTLDSKSHMLDSNCLVIIVSDLWETAEILDAIYSIKHKNTFIIARESLNTRLPEIETNHIAVLCCHTSDKEALILLRTIMNSAVTELCLNISSSFDDLNWLPQLQIILKENVKIILYAQNSELNGILGLVACLRKEYGNDKIQCILIMDDAPKFDPNLRFYREQLDKNLVFNVWMCGSWGTYRHLSLPENELVESEDSYLKVSTSKELSTMIWTEGSSNKEDQILSDEDVVSVYYSAINYKNLKRISGSERGMGNIASNINGEEWVFSFDIAGKNAKGDRVMGMCSDGSVATSVRGQLLLPIPEEWTMEDAATVMYAYGTVIAALLKDSPPKSGESILIHGGTEEVGLAAINISLHFGLTIFVTVETEAQYKFIQNYAKIKDKYISMYEDSSFEDMINSFTRGKGVDYIFNSWKGDTFSASTRCLAVGGKYIDTVPNHLENNVTLDIHLLGKEFKASMFYEDILYNSRSLDIYKHQFMNLIKQRVLKPLPRKTFQYHQLQEAYKCITESKYIGKVLLNIRDENNKKINPAPRTRFKAVRRFHCKPEYSYLICGGLGGFGFELANLLVARGAKKLILTSRSGLTNGYHLYKIRIWESCGVTTIISTKDVVKENDCIDLLKTANKLGPLHGIFNLALILKDALFENQSIQAFKTVMASKAFTTRNLDIISRKLCLKLRYFVVFSSFVSGRGVMGLTNYGMANSVVERICEKRKKDGYPALAIQWGAVADVGIVAKLHQNEDTILEGTIPQKLSICLRQMDTFLEQDEPVVASMLIADKKDDIGKGDLFETVLNIMGIKNVNTVSMQFTLSELGMDSKLRVEIKQTLEGRYGIFLKTQDLLIMTLEKLKTYSPQADKKEIKISGITYV